MGNIFASERCANSCKELVEKYEATKAVRAAKIVNNAIKETNKYQQERAKKIKSLEQEKNKIGERTEKLSKNMSESARKQFVQPVAPQKRTLLGGSKNTKSIRKHRGIYQSGPKAGKLRQGFKYTGERTKTGLKVIAEIKK